MFIVVFDRIFFWNFFRKLYSVIVIFRIRLEFCKIFRIFLGIPAGLVNEIEIPFDSKTRQVSLKILK